MPRALALTRYPSRCYPEAIVVDYPSLDAGRGQRLPLRAAERQAILGGKIPAHAGPMTWRLLDSGPSPGWRQMAIDEALLEAVARRHSTPVLHLFAFAPLCLSLGRFQAARYYLEPYRLDGIHVVRRPTGGSAVLHAGDLCYGVVAPIDDVVVGGSLRQTYRRLALAFTRALELLGASPDPMSERQGKTSDTPPLSPILNVVPGPWACFAALGSFEVTVAGIKVVGSAQARRGRAFLQQGSFRLAADREREGRLLGEGRPSLADLLGRPISYAEAAAALRCAFAEALGLAFEDSPLTPEEECLAQALGEGKYASAAWTWGR